MLFTIIKNHYNLYKRVNKALTRQLWLMTRRIGFSSWVNNICKCRPVTTQHSGREHWVVWWAVGQFFTSLICFPCFTVSCWGYNYIVSYFSEYLALTWRLAELAFIILLCLYLPICKIWTRSLVHVKTWNSIWKGLWEPCFEGSL